MGKEEGHLTWIPADLIGDDGWLLVKRLTESARFRSMPEAPKARQRVMATRYGPRITEDLRLPAGPCRGSRRREELCDERTISERSFSELKESFQAERPRHAGIAQVRAHLALSIIASTAVRIHAKRQRLAEAV